MHIPDIAAIECPVRRASARVVILRVVCCIRSDLVLLDMISDEKRDLFASRRQEYDMRAIDETLKESRVLYASTIMMSMTFVTGNQSGDSWLLSKSGCSVLR